MARKRHKAEEIVAKLRQVDVLMAQGKPVADAVRAKSMMSAVKDSSSSGVIGILRCVDRCCPSAKHARLCGTPSSVTT